VYDTLSLSGRLRWVQVHKRLVDQPDPDAGMICSYVDVDERRRAREAVQLQAERTRAILDSVLVGIVTVGDGGIEWMNRSARRMFGGELADFVGEPISIVATAEADHPLRARRIDRRHFEAARSGLEQHRQRRDRRKSSAHRDTRRDQCADQPPRPPHGIVNFTALPSTATFTIFGQAAAMSSAIVCEAKNFCVK